MNTMIQRTHDILVLASAVTLSGCGAAAVGAAAGAAGAIAYTERGARSQVEASLAEASNATEAVFRQMGIRIVEREVDTGEEIEIEGEIDGRDVNVDIEREDADLIEIEVTASENVVDYDREYARDVLRRIVERL